jgi:glucosamine--fructose-6-phosphate aminotransferase (isomerizing)
VAATKSFIAQLVAGARLVASWQDDAHWRRAGRAAARAGAARARGLVAGARSLREADRLFVVGRGLACRSRWKRR